MTGNRITRALADAIRALLRRRVTVPTAEIVPAGEVLDLPGRGRTFVVDIPGPAPDAPTVVLLHALGTTAYLSWYPTFEQLARRYRVLTFDLRWHGRGIRSARFRFADCADDVAAVLDALDVDQAIVAGYSMGGAVAQLTWQRHPERVAGLVLCSTARNFRGKTRERFFFAMLTGAMQPLSRYALARVERLAATLPDTPSIDTDDIAAWGRAEFRSTSAWVMPEVLGELGRFNSAAWIGDVDVPTAVVITARDRAVPVRRQQRLAASIPDAAVFTAPGGHASIVLDAARWVPIFLDAVASVADRHAVAATRQPE
jgi:pimeloyl-ACP methyl ester carboxylesterase